MTASEYTILPGHGLRIKRKHEVYKSQYPKLSEGCLPLLTADSQQTLLQVLLTQNEMRRAKGS